MEQETKARSNKKTQIGKVISDKMDKTVVVGVEMTFKHPIYKKIVKKTKKFKAHDNKNECQIGDKVKIVESRPISKNKCWRVTEILEKVK